MPLRLARWLILDAVLDLDVPTLLPVVSDVLNQADVEVYEPVRERRIEQTGELQLLLIVDRLGVECASLDGVTDHRTR